MNFHPMFLRPSRSQNEQQLDLHSTSPTATMTLQPINPLSPDTEPPPQPLITPSPLLHKRDDDDTITESITIFITERVTEQISIYLTDTVFINETVYIHDTVTRTLPPSTLTLRPSPITLTTTFSATPSSISTISPPAAAKQTIEPIARSEGPKGPVIAGAVVGSLAGVALLMVAAWFAVRKWRVWNARRNQRMQGVELQRRWEREQEMRGREGVVGGV
ncbi:MAG: hypothetical protein Q9169_003877 [Polycauliona sp. 2 TL-2023]